MAFSLTGALEALSEHSMMEILSPARLSTLEGAHVTSVQGCFRNAGFLCIAHAFLEWDQDLEVAKGDDFRQHRKAMAMDLSEFTDSLHSHNIMVDSLTGDLGAFSVMLRAGSDGGLQLRN